MKQEELTQKNEKESMMKLEVQENTQFLNYGHWTQKQNLLYVIFLDKNNLKFSASRKIKKVQTFQKMSEFIQTRSAVQCRSHHQKYHEKFGDALSIISIYKEEIGQSSYRKYKKMIWAMDRESRSKFQLPTKMIQKSQQENKESKSVGTQTNLQEMNSEKFYEFGLPRYYFQNLGNFLIYSVL